MTDPYPTLPSGLVLPRGVRIIDPNPEPVEEVGPPCAKCGLPLPPLDDETLRALQRAGGLATLAHEVCPGETAPPPPGRSFEVRVRIVEVEPRQPAGQFPADVTVTELISFSVGGLYPDLDTAMRPLAEQLGERWLEAEKQARIADADYDERKAGGS